MSTIRCPTCQRPLSLPEYADIVTAQCPLCQSSFDVPGREPWPGPTRTALLSVTTELPIPDASCLDEPVFAGTAERKARRRWKWLLVGVCSMLLVVCAVGLGLLVWKSNQPTANAVEGTVLYKGRPHPGGAIFFHLARGQSIRATIGPDGRYKFANVPTGETKVTIDAFPWLKDVRIPARYTSKTTTPLRLNVKPGQQRVDFALTN
jgi:hypothetical protein